MFAPLSGKLKMKMQLDQAKAQADEQRKQELQAIKVEEAEAKANMALQFKTRDQIIKEKEKLTDAGISSPIPPLKLMPDQYGYSIPEGDDQIAAVKTGEAIIPVESAQDPKYKPIIQQMVDDGRREQTMTGYKRGTVSIPKPSKGSTGVLQSGDMLPTIPTVGSRRKLRGYSEGTAYVAGVSDPKDWKPMFPTEADFPKYMKQTSEDIAASARGDNSFEAQQRRVNADRLALEQELKRLPDNAEGDMKREILNKAKGDLRAPLQPAPLAPRPTPEAISYANNVLGNPAFMGTPEQINAQKVITAERQYQTQAKQVPPQILSTASGMGMAPTIPQKEKPLTTLDEYDHRMYRDNPNYKPKPRTDALAGLPRNESGLYDPRSSSSDDTPQEQPPTLDSTAYTSEERNQTIADFLRDKSGQVSEIASQAAAIQDPKEKRGFFNEMLSGLFGEGGFITPRDAMRMALVAGGGMLTGGSVNGSLKYAGLDFLKQVDERESNQYLDDRAGTTARAKAASDAQKNTIERYQKDIEEGVKYGRIKPELARELRLAAENPKQWANLERVLGSPVLTQNQKVAAGLNNDDKEVLITPSGRSSAIPAFRDPQNPGHYIYFKGDKTIRTKDNPNATHYEGGPSKSTPELATKAVSMLDDTFLKGDGKNPPILDKGSVAAQLTDWSERNRTLGLPDDPSFFMAPVNLMLRQAVSTGERHPNITRLMDMATINTASLADTDKSLDSSGKKTVPTSYIGKAYEDITSPFSNGKTLPKFKSAEEFMNFSTNKFDKFKESGTDPLKGVDPKSEYYRKISSAPNLWWKYVYRNLYENTKKE